MKEAMNVKQLREDIYNDLFDSMRIASAIDESLDDRCYRMTDKIMKHIGTAAPVSLARCINAAAEVDKEPFVGYRSIAIAILTIAVVEYVD